jgi:hypothetical protein
MRIRYLIDHLAPTVGTTLACVSEVAALTARGHDVQLAVLRTFPAGGHRFGPPPVRFDDILADPGAIPDVTIVTSRATLERVRELGPERAGRVVARCEDQDFASVLPQAAARGAVSAVFCPSAAHSTSLQQHLAEVAVVTAGHAVAPSQPPDEELTDIAQRPIRVAMLGDDPVALDACDLAVRAGQPVEAYCVHPQPGPSSPGAPGWSSSLPGRSTLVIHTVRPDTVDDYLDAIAACDVVILTGTDGEAGAPPAMALHTIAAGRPVILADTPGHRGYWPRPYALFAETGNPGQFAEALVIVGRHIAVRTELRDSAYSLLAELDPRHVATTIEATLSDVVSSTPTSSPEQTATPTVPFPATRPLGADAPDLQTLGQLTDRVPGSAISQPVEPIRAARTTPTDDSSLNGAARRELQELRDRLVDSLRETADLERHHSLWARAEETLRAALTLRADDPDLLQKHGHAAYLAGDDRASLASFDRLIELGASNPDLFHNRGLVLYSLGELRHAAQSFEDALRAMRDPSSEPMFGATLLNDLGVVQHALHDVESARVAFERALRVDPYFEEARRNLEQLGSTA